MYILMGMISFVASCVCAVVAVLMGQDHNWGWVFYDVFFCILNAFAAAYWFEEATKP